MSRTAKIQPYRYDEGEFAQAAGVIHNTICRRRPKFRMKENNSMHKRIIFVMGVSGSGKSTIGKMTAHKLDLPFFDGDDFHPEENVTKMQAGIPLNDEDRYVWLNKLNEIALDNANQEGSVIACSALKESYRMILMDGIEDRVKWIFLDGEYNLIKNRMQERKTHFMPVKLLQSQFDALEIPSYAIRISIDKTPENIVMQILKHLEY